jgi:hypothetical protein
MNLPAERLELPRSPRRPKKAQEATAANDQVPPALRAELEAELSSAQEATAEAKGKADQAPSDMFGCMLTCCQLMQNSLGTR